MSDFAIKAENLSKRYFIGHQGAGTDALRHVVEHAVRHPIQWLREKAQARRVAREEFWALSEVAFSVRSGESVAIIGRNGAGKSTLLKILSRITQPTTGRITIKGRVASLLEVGTGFHQELTGRENIFLNGAILGMRKAEISRKFDEIVAFSEIERFLDTPVKRYSSGMYVRLAFAVAAHLEPEILIVDEVLAVGDAAFQQKCLGRMGQVSTEGRTVLFVSHNMSAIQSLCNRAIYLENGKIAATGPVACVVDRYLQHTHAHPHQLRSGGVTVGGSLKVTHLQTDPTPVICGGKATFTIALLATKPTRLSELSLLIYNAHGSRSAIIDFRPAGLPLHFLPGQLRRFKANVSPLPLLEGNYTLGIFAGTTQHTGDVFEISGFAVRAKPREQAFAPYALEYRGHMELESVLAIEEIDAADSASTMCNRAVECTA